MDLLYIKMSLLKTFRYLQRLPPTRDTFVLHIKRSNFQVAEWKDALIFKKTARDPNGNSWERNGNKLQINWTTKK